MSDGQKPSLRATGEVLVWPALLLKIETFGASGLYAG